jgi:hypothetical protein
MDKVKKMGTLSADRGEIEIKITEGRCEDET